MKTILTVLLMMIFLLCGIFLYASNKEEKKEAEQNEIVQVPEFNIQPGILVI